MLDPIAQRLSRSARQRSLLFVCSALISILLIGYHFGTFDQAVHIPFLKASVDPLLFPGDKFIEMRLTHYSYFWHFFQPFYGSGWLEVAMFVVHVLATCLTFWGLWELSWTLFHSPLASLFSVVAFIFPHLGFADFPVIEFSLLNRTFVFPFLLFAITLFLRQRYLLAFALLGLMVNLHAVSVNFVLAMLLLDCVIEFRRIGVRNIVGGVCLFVIAALPVLLWKMGASPIDLSLRGEWFSVVSRGALYNVFYLFGPYPHIYLATLAGFCSMAWFFAARSAAPSSGLNRTVTVFMVAVLLVLAVEQIVTLGLPVTILIQSQILRIGFWGMVLGYLYFANLLSRYYQDRSFNRAEFAVLAGVFFLFPVAIFPFFVWALRKVVLATKRRRIGMGLGLLVTLVGIYAGLWSFQIWFPGIYVFARQTPWYTVQRWARDNTPRDAVFITPPHKWWFYESDWRVFSERRTVATLSELLEAAFNPDYISLWEPRFDALAPGALERFRGDYFENVEITRQAFDSLPTATLLHVACDYGASYLVVEKPRARDLPLVYANDAYLVYDLHALDCPE